MYAMYYEQKVVGEKEGTAGGDEGDGTGGEDGGAGGSSHIEH